VNLTKEITHIKYLRSEAKIKMLITIFWVMMQYDLAGSYQHFGGMYRLHLKFALKMKAISSSKMMVTIYKATQCQHPEDHN
jgi:hypothetical protein